MFMGNVMIALNDQSEDLLRYLANERYKGKKGALSDVVTDALNCLKESSNCDTKKEFIAFLRKGLNVKYTMYKSRDEIYD